MYAEYPTTEGKVCGITIYLVAKNESFVVSELHKSLSPASPLLHINLKGN